MGRMLDTLKLGEGRRPVSPMTRPADDPGLQDRVVDWEIGEEVPFVEVGGPNKKVELSPALMKHPPQPAQPPHLVVETPAKTPSVQLTQAPPMTIAFEPWPAAAATTQGISPEIIAYHQPDHATSKEYAGLLDAMLNGVTGSHVALLCGMKPHVGTSTVLLNLAVIAAQAKKLKVALIDADAAQSSLAQRLGCEAFAGLGEVVAGTLALEQAIIRTPIASLHLLPAGAAIQPGPLTSEAVAWIGAWVRERFDLAIIDGATLDDASSALCIPNADSVYLVLPQGESVAKDAASTVARRGGRLCGLIHTRFEI